MSRIGQYVFQESIEDIMARKQALMQIPGWVQFRGQPGYQQWGERQAREEAFRAMRGEGPGGSSWQPGYGGIGIQGAKKWYLSQQEPVSAESAVGPGPRKPSEPPSYSEEHIRWVDENIPMTPFGAGRSFSPFPLSPRQVGEKLRQIPGGGGVPASYGPLGPPGSKAAGRTWRSPFFYPQARGFGMGDMRSWSDFWQSMEANRRWMEATSRPSVPFPEGGASKPKLPKEEEGDKKKGPAQLIFVPPESFPQLQAQAFYRGLGPYPGAQQPLNYVEPREVPSVYNNPWMAAAAFRAQSSLPSVSFSPFGASSVSLRGAYQAYVNQGASPFAAYQGASRSFSSLRGLDAFSLGGWIKEEGAEWAIKIGIVLLVIKVLKK